MNTIVVVQMPGGTFKIENKSVADVIYALTPCKTIPEYQNALAALKATKPPLVVGEGFKRFGPRYITSFFSEDMGPEVPIDIYKAEAMSVKTDETKS